MNTDDILSSINHPHTLSKFYQHMAQKFPNIEEILFADDAHGAAKYGYAYFEQVHEPLTYAEARFRIKVARGMNSYINSSEVIREIMDNPVDQAMHKEIYGRIIEVLRECYKVEIAAP
jgi:hypothetical protein